MVDLTDGILAFTWSSDVGGTKWYADVGDGSTVSNSASQNGLPGGFNATTASISLSSFAGAVDLSAVTQLSLHFDGARGLDASTDDVRVAVPEPSILALFSIGLLGLGWKRRRRAG